MILNLKNLNPKRIMIKYWSITNNVIKVLKIVPI